MAAVARSLGLRARTFTPALLDRERIVVDGVLGTGVRGAPHGPVGAAVEALERCGRAVVALDVPSGVDADSGMVPGAAVRAALTVTFHGDKPGLRVEPGRARAGEVVVADIGIPAPGNLRAVRVARRSRRRPRPGEASPRRQVRSGCGPRRRRFPRTHRRGDALRRCDAPRGRRIDRRGGACVAPVAVTRRILSRS